MILTMLPKKRVRYGFRPFFKIACHNQNVNMDNISSSNLHKSIVLLALYIFSWSKNRVKPLMERLGHSYVANSEKSKMDASTNNLLTKSRSLYCKPNYVC